MVEYILRPNTLDGMGNSYRAQVVNSESFGTEDLIDYVSRTNAGISRPEIASIEVAFEDAFAYFLSQGKFFHSPMLNVSVSIRGSFKEDEHPTSANVHANAHIGQILQQAAEKAGLKHGQASIKWAIERVVDVSSASVDDRITIGHNIRVEGKGLTVAGAASGVQFAPTAGGAPIKATIDQMAVNTPSLLVFEAPSALTAGSTYHLSILSMYNPNGATFGSLHTIPYDVVLTART
jgi:hypothetical protein